MPPHRLSLKINQPVMLLRNVNQAEGLCNGTRLIIQELHKHYLKVIMTMGKNKGKIFLIQRMVITPSDIRIPVNPYPPETKKLTKMPKTGTKRSTLKHKCINIILVYIKN